MDEVLVFFLNTSGILFILFYGNVKYNSPYKINLNVKSSLVYMREREGGRGVSFVYMLQFLLRKERKRERPTLIHYK